MDQLPVLTVTRHAALLGTAVQCHGCHEYRRLIERILHPYRCGVQGRRECIRTGGKCDTWQVEVYGECAVVQCNVMWYDTRGRSLATSYSQNNHYLFEHYLFRVFIT